MTPVFLRLAFAGLRRRALQATLTVLVVAAAASALTIALGIERVADRSWERTFAATNGAHATVFAPPGELDAAAIEELPGVVGSTGRPAIIGVSVEAGATPLTSTLAGPPRLASHFTAACRPPFEAT